MADPLDRDLQAAGGGASGDSPRHPLPPVGSPAADAVGRAPLGADLDPAERAGAASPGGTPAGAGALPVGPVVRAVLAVYGASLAVTGVWAAAFPRSFYDDFPGLGRVWVAVDGPYNEHLARDVGTLYLALATLLVVAAVRATPTLVAVAAGVNLVNAVPHFAYHALNLDVYDTTDQVANLVVLTVAIVAPAAILLRLTRTD